MNVIDTIAGFSPDYLYLSPTYTNKLSICKEIIPDILKSHTLCIRKSLGDSKQLQYAIRRAIMKLVSIITK